MQHLLTYPICLLVIALGLFSMPETSSATTNTSVEADNTLSEQEEKLLTTIIKARYKVLQRIIKGIHQLKQQWSSPTETKMLAKKIAILEREFRAIKTMAQISITHPIETSMMRSFLTELLQNITQVTTPFKNDMDTIQADIRELLNMVHNDDLFDITKTRDHEIRDFFSRLANTKQSMEQAKQELEELLQPALALQNDIIQYEKKVTSYMPGLWRTYYLVPTGRPFDPKSWHNLSNDVVNTFNMRLNTEIPQSGTAWMALVLRMLLASSLFYFLHRLKGYILKKAPTSLAPGALRLCNHSLFWLCMALFFFAALFSRDTLIYYPFMIVSIFCLYFAQMSLAWDLYAFSHPQISRNSTLWPLFIAPCAGLLLMLADLPPVITTIGWLITLIIAFITVCRTKKTGYPFYLPSILLFTYLPFICLIFIMGLLGWTRLAVISSIIYGSIGLLLQQSIGIIRISDIISKILPRQGLLGILWGALLAILVPLLLILLMILSVLWLLPYPGSRYFLIDISDFILSSGSDSLSFLQIIFIISIFFIVRSCIQVVHLFLASLPSRASWFSGNLIQPIQATATYVFWGLFSLYVLQAFGFNLSNLAVVAGGFSVGIGFGMQHVVGNFFSGLLVIFGEIVRVDDIIEIQQDEITFIGVVKKISIRSTTMETFDNATIFIPNQELISGCLTNWTRNGRMVRKKIMVSVAHGTDIQKVIDLLQQVVENNYEILEIPEPRIRFKDFNDGKLNFTIGIWVADITRASTIAGQVITEIEKLFRVNDISIIC